MLKDQEQQHIFFIVFKLASVKMSKYEHSLLSTLHIRRDVIIAAKVCMNILNWKMSTKLILDIKN